MNERAMVRFVIPSAIRCFFHVYEEHLGTYGFRVRRHVLATPGPGQHTLALGCDRDVDPHEYVIIGNNITVDRTWCRTCAATVAAEARRGHTPDKEIL
jgi:hypothetical protein